MKKTGIVFLCVVSLAMGWQARAQTFDNSGNGMLKGSYYFRQVYLYGNGSDASAAFGEITFNGSGSYTLSASAIDYSQGSGTLTTSGTYTISASGLGYITNPLASGSANVIYGLVSQGIFIGSSTQNPSGFNDLFIAAPIGSATPAFSGTYSVAFMDLGLGISGKYQLSPNGSGSLGTVAVSYYGVNSSGATFTGSSNESGVKYTASNGAESMTFPSSTQSTTLPVSGQEYLYSSPDGNFVFGGSPQGFDFFVGVHASSSPTFSGLYYQAGIDLAGDAYYGSLDAIPSIDGLLGHQRILDLGSTYYDYTYSDASQLNPDGSYDDGFAIHHVFGQIGSLGAGSISVGYGTDGNSGINVAIQGPTLSGSGSAMYLNPIGVQNQSSSALFTAGIAPGEYITLTGNNLVSGTNVAPNFPASYPTTGLGGIEVLMNGYSAPLVYTCSKCDGGNDLIIAVTPWELTGAGVVQIQAVSTASGTRSNAVTLFQSMTAPGLKASENGIGDVSAQHASNFSLITSSSPAQIGETIVLYAVGLGSVSPMLADGAAGGSTISSITEQPLTVYFDDGVNAPASATIGFSGLVAGYVNLYQLNVTVPSGINSGDVFVEIAGPDSYTSEASIPIGSSGLAASAKADKQIHRRPTPATKAPRGLNPNVRLPAGAN
jgi:uncharacterized protein (TIGR03437 family)